MRFTVDDDNRGSGQGSTHYRATPYVQRTGSARKRDADSAGTYDDAGGRAPRNVRMRTGRGSSAPEKADHRWSEKVSKRILNYYKNQMKSPVQVREAGRPTS